MNLAARTEGVLGVYRRLDLHLNTFCDLTGLSCPSGCGECCLSASVEATILELLPAAVWLDRQGRLPAALELLRSNEAPDHCLFYSPKPLGRQGGHCGGYARRPLMCRLFGFAARVGREGRRQLVSCRKVRERMPEQVLAAREGVESGRVPVPVMGNYAMEIFSLDPSLGARFYPINEALVLALEMVGFDLRRRRKAG